MKTMILAALLSTGGTFAAAASARAELSDAAIAQRVSELDAAYHAAADEAEREFQQSVAFHARLKDERLGFERRLLDDRKGMLESLRGMPAAQRQAAYDGFHVDEARKRQDFRRHEMELKLAFRRQFLEERGDAQRALKRRRQALGDRRR